MPARLPTLRAGSSGRQRKGAAEPPATLAIASAVLALHRDGHHEQALEAVDNMVAEQAERHGQESAEVAHASSAAVRLCNELALSAMQHGAPGFSFEHAHTYLQRALHMPSASPSLIPVTLNNLSIFYTRTGQPQKALRCLLRVVKQAKVPSSSQDSVAVHAALNLTTVLADMGRHREALQMAQQAVRNLPRSANGRSADPSLLCAAYHNLAVQQERLGSTAGHMQSYRAALAQVRRPHYKFLSSMCRYGVLMI